MKNRLSLEQRRIIRKKGWYKNEAETAAARVFQKQGIKYVRRGYPDFTIVVDDEIFGFIEVKPHNMKELKPDQVRFERLCKRYGIPFIKWTPEDGEEAITSFIRTLH